ncbi:MAG TPA: 50S ribosomal protein L5 [bacterium]
MEKAKQTYNPRLWTMYQHDILPRLMKQFKYKSPMQAPRITKIALNMGVGEAIQDPKFIESAAADLSILAGQKAILTKAKKSISNFKLRQGMAIGCRVTLRRWRMYEFLDRLLNVAIPRIRDFRGLEQAGFDGRGNFTLGIREHIIFPEISYDKVLKIRGLNVTICTTAKTDEEAFTLLREFGMPFRVKDKNTNNA